MYALLYDVFVSYLPIDKTEWIFIDLDLSSTDGSAEEAQVT